MSYVLKCVGVVAIAVTASLLVRFGMEELLGTTATLAASTSGFIYGVIFSAILYKAI